VGKEFTILIFINLSNHILIFSFSRSLILTPIYTGYRISIGGPKVTSRDENETLLYVS